MASAEVASARETVSVNQADHSASGLFAIKGPAMLWVLAASAICLSLIPIAYLVIRTFGAGAETVHLLLRARTLEVLLGSIGLALAVTAGSAVLAVPLAFLTVRTDLPARRLLAVLGILPLAVPSYVGGFVIVAAFGPKGMLQQLVAGPLGVDRLPEIYGFQGAALALTLFSYPYLLLSVRAGLRGLDPALEEASRSLGCSGWSTFWRVIVPQLRPSLAAGALLVSMYTLSDFGAVSLLQFNSFTRAIYLQYQGSFDRAGAALLALLLVLLTGLILVAESRTRGRARYYRQGAGAARPAALFRLGRWRWPALALASIPIASALVLPVFVLLYWLIRGLDQGLQTATLWQATINSSYASCAAAVVAVVAALPVAVLAVRYPSKLSTLVERASYVGFALPGIVVALALVFFTANFVTPIYQTLVVLVAAYVVRFLPEAVGTTRSSLLQASPSFEEAARSLGRRPFEVLLAVTIPLVRPGILAGLALVFLTTIKELPATLLLSPIGFRTLATETWRQTAEGFFAQAAAPALLLVLVSAGSMILLLRYEGKLYNA